MDFLFEHEHFLGDGRNAVWPGLGFLHGQRLVRFAGEFLQCFLAVIGELVALAAQTRDDFGRWVFGFLLRGKSSRRNFAEGFFDVMFEDGEKVREFGA